MADVPQVTVTAVAVFCIKWKVDAVCFTVSQLVFTGLHGPYIGHSPRSDYFDIRSKGFDAELETDLVISFTGSAVADGNSTFFSCDLNEFFCDNRTCHGSTEQVFILINSACFYARHDEVFTELVDNVFDI